LLLLGTMAQLPYGYPSSQAKVFDFEYALVVIVNYGVSISKIPPRVMVANKSSRRFALPMCQSSNPNGALLVCAVNAQTLLIKTFQGFLVRVLVTILLSC